ncbi:hypothetical protein [Actinosynnema sp. NPDC023587]|uniref:hypothetical protein n=1 Tax=Actinosynnema sp. NPDC023587 TaxID=3154695 RepID=UPI0033F46677
MEANLFSLVPASDPTLVFAWGMEIVDDDRTEAVLYRRDPGTGRGMVARHTSAEAALHRWGRLVPLRLVWEFEDDTAFQATGAAERG